MAFVCTTCLRCWEESALTLCPTPTLAGSSFSLLITAGVTSLPNRIGANPSFSVTRLNCRIETTQLTLPNFASAGSCVSSVSQLGSTAVLQTAQLLTSEQYDTLETASSSLWEKEGRGYQLKSRWPHWIVSVSWGDHSLTCAKCRFFLWSPPLDRQLHLCPDSPPLACCRNGLKGTHPPLITHSIW